MVYNSIKNLVHSFLSMVLIESTNQSWVLLTVRLTSMGILRTMWCGNLGEGNDKQIFECQQQKITGSYVSPHTSFFCHHSDHGRHPPPPYERLLMQIRLTRPTRPMRPMRPMSPLRLIRLLRPASPVMSTRPIRPCSREGAGRLHG
jgi:hypothetical protein